MKAAFAKFARRREQLGQALILGLLAVIVIIMIAGSVMYPKLAGRSEYGSAGNVKGAATPMDRAYDVACTTYMQQVSAAAVQYRQDHNAPPPDLESLKPYGVTEDIINTPDCNFGLPKIASRPTGAAPGYPAPAAQSAQQQPAALQQPTSTVAAPDFSIHVPTGGGEGEAEGQ